MIKCLHLDEKLCNEPVYKLSGGTRRRLSVGLAFVTNPNLVVNIILTLKQIRIIIEILMY